MALKILLRNISEFLTKERFGWGGGEGVITFDEKSEGLGVGNILL